jgi:hypothetical protein
LKPPCFFVTFEAAVCIQRLAKDISPPMLHENQQCFCFCLENQGMPCRLHFVRGSHQQHPCTCILHVGQWQFSPPRLQAFRQAVASEPAGSQLEEAIRTVKSAGDYHVGGLHYKKVPSGYPPDHPRAELLKFNGLYASTQAIPASLLGTPGLVEACFEHCRNLSPLHRWLVELWNSLAA